MGIQEAEESNAKAGLHQEGDATCERLDRQY